MRNVNDDLTSEKKAFHESKAFSLTMDVGLHDYEVCSQEVYPRLFLACLVDVIDDVEQSRRFRNLIGDVKIVGEILLYSIMTR